MYYTVAEISEKTGLSKTSIYNRLQFDEFKQHTTKKQGVTYITENGLQLIEDSINNFNNEKDDKKTDSNIQEDFISHLKNENKNLWNELREKNQHRIYNFCRNIVMKWMIKFQR